MADAAVPGLALRVTAAGAATWTVRGVTTRFDEWHQARSGAWSTRYADEVERIGTKIIKPKLGKRIMAETTRSDWTDLVAGVRAKTPGTGSWAYSVASAFLSHSEAMGWINHNPLPRRG